MVVEAGAGVTSLRPGDHVIPLYIPECRQCPACLSGKTNLCTAIRETQGRGVMPDGKSRFSAGGRMLHHYMGTSTFANFTVVPEIALAKVREDAPFDSICYIGCGVTTGVGAVINTAKVQVGDTVVVFGLGGIGLNVVQGARIAGARMIAGVDLNPARQHDRREIRPHAFRQPGRGSRRSGALPGRSDRRRRRLRVRVHRQRQADAPGAGVLPSRMGHLRDNRRCGRGRGDLDAAVSAGYRAHLEGHRVRGRPGGGATSRRSSTGTWTAKSTSTT